MIRSFKNKETRQIYEGARKKMAWVYSTSRTAARTVMTNKMRAIHPGEILRDELDCLGLSANQFAMKLHVPANRISTILNGKRAISAETALRLARFFGSTPEFWINLQTSYDLKIEYDRSWQMINKEVACRSTDA